MGRRIAFLVSNDKPYYIEKDIEFKYNPGFALVQSQKNINNLHNAIVEQIKTYDLCDILEISSKSTSELGVALSAFNLKKTLKDGCRYPVENIFQAGKCFENGEQYIDLLNKTPKEAKIDERLKNSGNIEAFKIDGIIFPTEPKTMFYDWLYITALEENKALSEQLIKYSAFTDIVFNPMKSINCQARSAAIFVSIKRLGLINEAIRSVDNFKEIIYNKSNIKQISIFD